ncbi:unnamed protein product [Staurois parvus]|uniref:Uncharacterized protein n=1 Tax=Staurois parvus TaxID=386267 RepID=A0ABN9CSR5_9NEOB|nr:unnamed protein product [Staurois parvus]
MRCPWYLFHRFFEFGQGHRGPMIPYCPGGPHELSVRPWLDLTHSKPAHFRKWLNS